MPPIDNAEPKGGVSLTSTIGAGDIGTAVTLRIASQGETVFNSS